jgi:hypothetical protein
MLLGGLAPGRRSPGAARHGQYSPVLGWTTIIVPPWRCALDPVQLLLSEPLDVLTIVASVGAGLRWDWTVPDRDFSTLFVVRAGETESRRLQLRRPAYPVRPTSCGEALQVDTAFLLQEARPSAPTVMLS